ncbi:MAG: hypothetical protein M3Y34_01300, partial [Actinomycetota bacterium]|nr:hypothetical protein [Actinomycetota bacterium]
PEQLKITHTALKSLLDDFGHDEPEIHRIIHSLLDKLPDDHAIRAIRIGEDGDPAPVVDITPAEAEPPEGPRGPADPADGAA